MRIFISLFLLLMGCSVEQLQSLEVSHQFSDAYIRQNRGKVQYNVPEVYELMHIAIALTPAGRRDCLLQRDTPYYRAVMAHFNMYRNHPLVTQVEKLLTANRNNYADMSDAVGYLFDGDRIVFGGVYRRHPLHTSAKFADYRALAEDFARVTTFRAFFRDQQPYYLATLSNYQQVVPITRMRAWLESQFPTRYDSYQLNLSPLMGCFHYTDNGRDNGFAETRMFVPLPGTNPGKSPVVYAAGQCRMVFTEIDHNYVNHVTSRYAKDLDDAMHDWRDWNTGQQGYKSNELTFNEYMTWAVFTLYVFDTTTPAEFAQIQADPNVWVDPFMSNRGFKRFSAFNDELLIRYKARKSGQTVTDLYPAMLDWMSKQ